VRRLANIDDDELRQGIVTLPSVIENMIMGRADPQLIQEQALLLEGGKLALKLRRIVAGITAEELAAEITRLALVADAEIEDGSPRLAMATHYLIEAGKAGDDALRQHILHWHAGRTILRQRREAGVAVREGSGGDGMAFPAAADTGPERTLN
jgi:hypothetical protein